MAWVIGQTVAERVAQIGIYFVVARLLGPTQFGIGSLSVAPALIAVTVVQAYSQTISSRGVRGLANTTDVFLASVLFGLLGSGCCVLASYFLSSAAALPGFVPLASFAALASCFTSLGSVAEGIIIRRQHYRAMALRRIVGIVAAGAGAIFLAVHGFGAWAIAFQTVATAFCSSVACLIAARWYPTARPSLAGIGRAIHFSTPLMGSSGVNMLTSRMSEIILGYWLGPAASGLFRMAQSVIDVVSSIALAPVTSIFLPYLARAKGAQACAAALDFVARRATVVMCMIALAGSIGSYGIFLVLPSAQWRGLDGMISILAISLPISAYLSLSQTYFIAQRRPRLALYINLFQSAALLSSLLLLLNFWPQPASAAWSNIVRLGSAFFLIQHFKHRIYDGWQRFAALGVLKTILGIALAAAAARLALAFLAADLAEWQKQLAYVAVGGVAMLAFAALHYRDIVDALTGRSAIGDGTQTA